jgi:oxygen-dependent protoporphyrinogen oxidase
VTTIAIVGGGVAGLVAARGLALGGADVTIFEAGDHLGGTVATHTVGGLILDAGAESFATRRGTVAALATELGLGDEIVQPLAAPAWLYRATGAVQLPATNLLGIPGVPLAADVIDVLGAPTAFRAYLDALLPGLYGARSKSLGELVRKRMGSAVLEKLVAPVTQGVHSRHPDELDLDRIAPTLRGALRSEGSLGRAVRSLRGSAAAGSQVSGIRGGIHRIVVELEADLERLGVTVVLGSTQPLGPVEGFDETVLAASSPEGATVTYLATLVLDAPALDENPRGTGVLIAGDVPGIRARALTHATAKWDWLRERADGRHVARLSYASPPSVAIAREDAAALLGVELPASSVLEYAQVQWSRPAAQPPVEGVTRVGEGVAGTGLAAVVLQAETAAASLLARLAPETP